MPIFVPSSRSRCGCFTKTSFPDGSNVKRRPSGSGSPRRTSRRNGIVSRCLPMRMAALPRPSAVSANVMASFRCGTRPASSSGCRRSASRWHRLSRPPRRRRSRWASLMQPIASSATVMAGRSRAPRWMHRSVPIGRMWNWPWRRSPWRAIGSTHRRRILVRRNSPPPRATWPAGTARRFANGWDRNW